MAATRFGVGRGSGGYDHAIVKRWTVQHEIFEGTRERAVATGDAIQIQVNCQEDAPGLDDPMDYRLVTILEVADNMQVSVCERIRLALRAAVSIRP